MLIEVSTRVTFPVYRSFYLFNFLQGKRSPWQARLTMVLPFLLLILMTVLFVLDPADLFNLIGIVVSLALIVLLALILTTMPRKYYKSVLPYLDGPTSFIFRDDGFEVESTSTRWHGHTDSTYDQLSKVYETDGFFYLYISKNQAHIVGKADMSPGTPAELSRLFAEKMGGRFIMAASARKAGAKN